MHSTRRQARNLYSNNDMDNDTESAPSAERINCDEANSPECKPTIEENHVHEILKCSSSTENEPPTLFPLIFGGSKVKLGEYPHMVALGSKSLGGFNCNCGGTLITRKHVLTAAHCIYSQTPEFVRLGTVNLSNDDFQEISVDRMEIHPGFSRSSKKNDIAIIVLAQPVDISDPEIAFPACLDASLEIPIDNVTVTGWGKTEEDDPCNRHDGGRGICKPINSCEWARNNNIRPRHLKPCSFNGDRLLVCCGDSSKNEIIPEINCNRSLFDPETLTECIKRRYNIKEKTFIDEPISDITRTTVTPNPETTTQELDIKRSVGTRYDVECKTLLKNETPPLKLLIYGGTRAKLKEFAHMVALGYKSQNNESYDFRCGGTLITSRWVKIHFSEMNLISYQFTFNYRHVLTAAHCLDSVTPDVVRLGMVDLSSTDFQQIDVKEMVKHPAYNKNTKLNDIAILVLSQAADISDPEIVYPACLDISPDYPRGNVTVIGFGETENQPTSNLLLKASLSLLEKEDCTKRFSETQIFALRHGINEGQL
uniref:CSON015271 protein n=1 Tax=Culicoides sonorensis TaxID=179676 RepID=A0A336MH57_CULSO